ncbi:hypothetical protein GPECTOR_1g849 [Gonium pectorale]|uniref:DUF962 domain-containing protein n=1 Tax=Gonium pectorale TaxID=33097 RepID=A0A150H4F2_GONPE|nr:hypothetical protein GPECTOR_1g849 [Gonium pectorale]|eukprot:KXZ56941.1 hypothetical protein GPECTOR_1g849 [Gonium pectorale]
MERFESFAQFYPFYLAQHSRRGTRLLHLLGTSLVLLNAGVALKSRRARLLLLTPLLGYAPAWLSHAMIERNKPATFTYPLWSLLADFRMAAEIVMGRQPLQIALEEPKAESEGEVVVAAEKQS